MVCCTLSSFETAEPYDWQIIIFPVGEEALTKKAISGWQDFHNPYYFPRPHRVYAFTQPGQRNSWATELQLEVLAGPLIYEAPSLLGHRATVRVVFAAGPWTPAGRRAGLLEDLRRLVWRNAARNDALAALAGICRNANLEALWPHGVLLGDQQFPVGVAGAARVVILVESVEHGRELQARLLGWPLLHAEDGGGAGQSPWERAFRTAQPVPEQAIVTIIRAAQFPQFDTDVLIMATGRKAPALPAGFPPLAASGERRQTLIIDIDDDFDRAARRDARERVNYYLGRGFAVDAAHGRTGQPGRSA